MAAIKSKVTISLGPFLRTSVDVHAAVEDDDKETSFRTICTGVPGHTDKDAHTPHPPAGVKQSLQCPVCSNDDRTTFGKGREIADGVFALVNADDIASAQVTEDVKISMSLTTHQSEDLVGTTLPGGKTYFLKPRKGEEQIYGLFVHMVQTMPDLAFLTVWASRTKPALYRLGTFGPALTAVQIAWPSSLKEVPQVDAPNFTDAELAQATMLARATVSPYDPASYKDERAEKLRAFIAVAEGVDGAVIPTQPSAPAAPASGGLAAMLQASLDALGVKAQPDPANALVTAGTATAQAKKAPAKRAPRKATTKVA